MIKIRKVEFGDLDSFNIVLNTILEEKIYLASVDVISIEVHEQFLKHIIDNKLPQVVAVEGKEVVGWCDILPNPMTGFSHVGRLGMGVVEKHRGKGIGKHLLSECIVLAKNLNLEKIELEVFVDNDVACKLYSGYGFLTEGVRRKARKLDGQYQDIQVMSYWLI